MNRKLLENKVAIITGGSSGMGRSMAELYAQEGAAVVIFARRQGPIDETVAAIEANGGTAMGFSGDVSDAESIKDCVKNTIERFGKIDILVNCAGKGSGSKSIEATDDDFFDQTIASNLRGPFIFCREVLAHYFEKGEGVIINVASVNAVRPIVGAAYASSKAGLLALTKNLAMRTVGTKIRINCLCPGLVLTPMAMSSTMTAKEQAAFGLSAETAAAESAAVPFDEVGPEDMFTGDGKMSGYLHARTNRFCISMPEELANTALFLASDMSSGIHGQAIVVDHGGYL